MSFALVLNSGSSSIKFQLVDPASAATDAPFVSGLVEQIGEPSGRVVLKTSSEKFVLESEIPDHGHGLTLAFDFMDEHGCGPSSVEVVAVGHRVVHGGTEFSGPTLIDDEAVEKIRRLIPLAPLHNPANLDGIEVARRILADIPHVAVFDTGFFQELPDYSANYAINSETARDYDIRRYGFHGTSHEFVSAAIPELLGRPAEEVNQIVLHLGNGASASAIRGGRPIDTSMGLTPLAGLVMGTRCGDIDPGIIFHLSRNAGLTIDEIDTLLNKRSGIKGIAGVNDFRVLHERIAEGDDQAALALELYLHQLRRFIGAYTFALGRLDAIAFTAGVGENDDIVRARALEGLENFGIVLDPERNKVRGDAVHEISAEDSAVKVFVVPTNEELAIARYAAAFV